MHCALEKSISTLAESPGFFALIIRGSFTVALEGAQRRLCHHAFLGVRLPIGGAPFVKYAVVMHTPECEAESVPKGRAV
jgi:hypothetical protein